MNTMKYLQYLKDKATAALNYPQVSEALYNRLCIVCENSLDLIFIEKIISKKLFDKYLENNNCDEIVALEEEFYHELLEKEDETLNTCNKLAAVMNETIQSFNEFIDEFLKRFDEDRKEIEETLFGGKKCNRIISLNPDSGDCHNHGRSTIIVETDVGKFVYKPHDIQIDFWVKQFFDKFFPQVSKLPNVVCKSGYGYCQFVENTPASTKAAATKYYEKLGQFCSIATILGSKDLHLENLLSDGIHPIPIDLEMMIYPIEKKEICDNSWLEKSILMTGLMPLKIDGNFEASLLFSEDDLNTSAPVIDGLKINVIGYQKEFLKGFESGYRAFLKQKNEIIEYVEQMPDFPVRHLFRGSNAYMKLISKAFSYQWIKDNNLDSEVQKALSTGFIKIGKTKPEMIESETKAILEANIPYFYSNSNSKNLYDCDGLIKENFFLKSCKENLLEQIKKSGLTDLKLEKNIIKASFERYPKKTDEHVKGFYDCSEKTDYIEQAEALFKKIIDKKTVMPDGTLFWFTIDSLQVSAMSPIKDDYVSGILGIAVFAAALSVCTTKEEIKAQSTELANEIISQVISDLKSYKTKEKIFENQLSLCFATGLAGMLHANELIDNYIHSPLCEEFRRLMMSLLPKLDTSYTTSDLFLGYAGIIKVLCKYENLYSQDGVANLVSIYCDNLLNMRVPLFNGKLLWDCLGNKRAISGAAHGQVGIASALLLAGKKLERQDLIDAATTAFEYEDSVFSEKLGTWPDFRNSEEPTEAMHGFCSGAPGVGFEMLGYDTDLGKRNVDRAIKACLSRAFLDKDTVCCGNCSVVDFLLNAGLVKGGQKRMNGIISNAQKNGFCFCNKDYNGVFEVSLFYGASGVGYECLRCADSNLIRPLYI